VKRRQEVGNWHKNFWLEVVLGDVNWRKGEVEKKELR